MKDVSRTFGSDGAITAA
ncbi:hypothetical protein Tco_1359217, partial [Tanacetum coccineum]